MRFDEYIVASKGLSRSKAQDLVKRGKVRLGTKIITKPAWKVQGAERLQILEKEDYVSRAGHKLSSAAQALGVEFAGKVVLDVGSSTGGFTDYALQQKAKTVVAVDVGTDQLHPKLRVDERVRLFEKTDIRDFSWPIDISGPDVVVADVSFISLTKVLPAIGDLIGKDTQLIMMAKPQFEAQESRGIKLNNGVVKNSKDRRQILSNFEHWLKSNGWVIVGKRDSDLAGSKGNVERFYLLHRS